MKLQVPDNDTFGNINNNNSSFFEDLYQLGPLYKHPVMYDHFKLPTDGSVQPREISSYHVADIFREYLTKKNLWQSRELQTADILTVYVDTDTANDSKLNKRKKENKFSEVCRRFQSFFETCQNQLVARAIFELCIVSSGKIGNPALIKEAIGFVLDNQKLWEDIVQFCPTECLPRNMSSVASGKPEVFDLTSDSSSEDESGLPYKQLGEDRERNFLSEIEEKVDELLKQALHSSSNFSLQISMNQLEAMEQSSYKFD